MTDITKTATDFMQDEAAIAVEAAAAGMEKEIRDAVRSGSSTLSKPNGKPAEELGSQNAGSLISKIGGPSIAAIDKLIAELHEARTYLQSEGERIQRETARYIKINQTALESVNIISGAVGGLRQASHPVQPVRKRENWSASMLNSTNSSATAEQQQRHGITEAPARGS
jgi:hypothetical protein